MEDYEYTNIFVDEFSNIAGNKKEIGLQEVLKINLYDENYEFKINLSHIRKINTNNFIKNKFLFSNQQLYSTLIKI